MRGDNSQFSILNFKFIKGGDILLCKNCKVKLTDIDIYCRSCGRPTEEYKKQFKLSEIQKVANSRSITVSHVSVRYNVLVALAVLSVVVLFLFDFIKISLWIDYIILNLFMIFLCPLLMLPLANVLDNEQKI